MKISTLQLKCNIIFEIVINQNKIAMSDSALRLILLFLQKNMTLLTAKVTLADSELTRINPNTTTETEMRETFCREIVKTVKRFAPPSGRAGNTEQGKCRLTNEYPFFLFLIGRWYYEKQSLYS